MSTQNQASRKSPAVVLASSVGVGASGKLPAGVKPVGTITPKEQKSWKDTYRGQYKVMHVGVGPERKEKHEKLTKLALDLGVKESALVWFALDKLLATPPTKDDLSLAGLAARGTAAGFCVICKTNESGRLEEVFVLEVAKRSDGGTETHQFFRYDATDENARNRSMNQATRAAKQMATMAGLGKEYKPRVATLEPTDPKAA